MTSAQFLEKTGHEPAHDDLERVNCPKAGSLTHLSCGWCETHDAPAWECLCFFGRIPSQPSIAARAAESADEGCLRLSLPKRYRQ